MAESVSSVAQNNMKWQIALALGLPVVVGVGYWYYSGKDKKRDLTRGERVHTKDREISIDCDTSNKVNNTSEVPLEKATYLKELGNKYFKNGQYEDALKYYDEAIQVCPKTEAVSLATFYQNKAATYEQLKDYEEVKKACTEALSLNPTYVKALLRRAKALEQLKDITKAFEDLTAACILQNFQCQQTLLNADRLLQELGRQHAKKAMLNRVPVMPSKHYIRSYLSTFSRDPIPQFYQKISSSGDHSKGFLKAVKCWKEEDYEGVIPACTEELNSGSESTYRNETLLLRGTFYPLIGENTLAMADLEEVINNEQADCHLRVNALIKRAYLHMQKEDQTSCFNDFQSAELIDPTNPDIYYHKGQVNLLMEKFVEAGEDFKQALTLSPDDNLTIVQKCFTDYRLALLLRDESKLQSIMETFEKIIKEHPNVADCYSVYAQVLSEKQEFEKADELYRKALEIDPQNSTIYVHRGLLKIHSSSDAEGAIKLITEALELDDKCGLGYETLGTIEVQRGNLKKAIEMFDKAIKLAKTENELSHLYSLRNVVVVQKSVLEKMNIQLPRDVINS